ncbi:hypothetical protein [Streptomyces sp. NPDC002611]
MAEPPPADNDHSPTVPHQRVDAAALPAAAAARPCPKRERTTSA